MILQHHLRGRRTRHAAHSWRKGCPPKDEINLVASVAYGCPFCVPTTHPMMQHQLSHIDNEHLLGGDAEKVLSLAVIGFAALNLSYALRPSTRCIVVL